MNEALSQVLANKPNNYILPFFWQHGEDEDTLRELMAAIHGAGCGAVCVESRPHPDFCGEKWWADMDVILDEARQRDMKVWILDDSHFPTGFANDGLQDKPDSLCRQNLFLAEKKLTGKAKPVRIDLKRAGLLKQPRNKNKGMIGTFMSLLPPARKFKDDYVLSLTARQGDTCIDLRNRCAENVLVWDKPEGDWSIFAVVASRNTGYHRNYINMTDPESCRVLIDRVYEPHWQHYAADFGKTIAGFFSDEPELGNGAMYAKDNFLGTEQDLPWSAPLEEAVAAALGDNWKQKLYLLWRDGEEAAQVRSKYMDALTKLTRSAFSRQVANWCHAHGVQYIGHVIEDDGQHCRTGSSLGHYFRGLQYQDMSGIDDIGGQVYPQGEDEPKINFMRQSRNGEFFHYGLAKLAQSAAAIEPRKKGNAMCEIFGNYGWEEGVKLEKYLADHFLVRGINYFVPHAFSGKAFPDPDCPPHFYAHGHNPQYRHFGALVRYMNRVATLTSSGRHEVPVAILYHGESEWADKDAMPFEKPLRALYDHQIDCHTVPADIFAEPEHYRVTIGDPLVVNEQKYRAFIVPACRYISQSAADGIAALITAGLPVFFVDRRPETVAETGEAVPAVFQEALCVPLEKLYDTVDLLHLSVPMVQPESDRLRLLHILGDTDLFFVVNEADTVYDGAVKLPIVGDCFGYDPWHNRCFPLRQRDGIVALHVEPLKSMFIVFGPAPELMPLPDLDGFDCPLATWQRSVCEGAQYPAFGPMRAVVLPDTLAAEMPKFSGFVRYETSFPALAGQNMLLEISDASEGVEVFLNGQSLGIQIAPPFRYDLRSALCSGENKLVIEVATTLERQTYPLLKGYRKLLASKPASESGLNGTVKLILK